MSASRPRTPAEWEAYLSALAPEALSKEAAAANTADFVRALLSEGYSGAEVEGVLIRYAKRLALLGEPLPTNGLYDLRELKERELPR